MINQSKGKLAPAILEVPLPKDSHGNDYAARLPDTFAAHNYLAQDDKAVQEVLSERRTPSVRKFGLIRGSGEWSKPMQWEVSDLIPKASIGYLGGPSASGKTFAAVELIGSLITGKPAFGQYRPKRTGIVIYCAVEGRQGISHRFEAWRESRNVPSELWEQRLIQTSEFFNFETANPAEMIRYAQELEASGEKVVLIVFDTLRTFGAISKENDSTHAQNAAGWMREVSNGLDCSVMCIHHSGKSSDTNAIQVGCNFDRLLRGSSDLGATAEFVIGVVQAENTEGQSVPWIWSAKLKDSEKLPPLAIPIRTHYLRMANGEDQEVGVISENIDPDVALSEKPRKTNKPNVTMLDAQHIALFVSRSEKPCERDDIRKDFTQNLMDANPNLESGSIRSRLSRAFSHLDDNLEIFEIHKSTDNTQYFKFPFRGD